jgi:hypothetical protein
MKLHVTVRIKLFSYVFLRNINLKISYFYQIITLNDTAIVTFDLVNTPYLVMIARTCGILKYSSIELVCNKHIFIVQDKSNVNFKEIY